jgi:hypothetical protein
MILIQTYNNFINEGFLISKEKEYYKFLQNYFKEYIKDTDFKLEYTFNGYYKKTFLHHKDFSSFTQTKLCFFIEKSKYNIQIFSNYYIADHLDEMKKFLDEYLNKKYYSNDLYKILFDSNSDMRYKTYEYRIKNIIILDREKYSEFIFNIIEKNKDIIKCHNIFYKYLTDDYKNKIEHIINASNFDLI